MTMAESLPGKIAIIGGGVIGGGWAARFLLNGWNVAVYDPHPEARQRIDQVLDNARRSLPSLIDVAMPREGTLSFAASLQEAVTGADWIQESVPEDLAVKHRVLADMEAHAGHDAVIASSTSGFRPSELQQAARNPGRIIVAHPFNPVYLLPLVEVVASDESSPSFVQQACDTLSAVGFEPLRVRKEIDAHLADRLLEAVWREALWLIDDDVATTQEVDDAIRYGFGLRWAQMGLFETYRLAGGEAGMAHFIRQFGPALQWPWSKLTDVPELTEELVNKIATQSDAQSAGHSIRELERIRDRNLVGLLRSLKERDWGAGATLNRYDRHLKKNADGDDPGAEQTPLRLLDISVLPAWIDYNGHMTEFRYTQVFSDTCEALLRRLGLHDEYVSAGFSYYTAETHTQFFDEVGVNEPIYTTAQILMADAKRLHVFYSAHAGADNRELATLEAMYLHVDMKSGRVCSADTDSVEELMRIAKLHSTLPRPESAGRHVGERKRRDAV